LVACSESILMANAYNRYSKLGWFGYESVRSQ